MNLTYQTFDDWLADLCVVAEEYGYVGNIVEDTGCEDWQHYYDNEESPGSAFFNFKFSRDN